MAGTHRVRTNALNSIGTDQNLFFKKEHTWIWRGDSSDLIEVGNDCGELYRKIMFYNFIYLGKISIHG